LNGRIERGLGDDVNGWALVGGGDLLDVVTPGEVVTSRTW